MDSSRTRPLSEPGGVCVIAAAPQGTAAW